MSPTTGATRRPARTCATCTARRSARSGTRTSSLDWSIDVDIEKAQHPGVPAPALTARRSTPSSRRRSTATCAASCRPGRSRSSCTASRARSWRRRSSSTACPTSIPSYYAAYAGDGRGAPRRGVRSLPPREGRISYAISPHLQEAARPHPHGLALGHEAARHADHGRRPRARGVRRDARIRGRAAAQGPHALRACRTRRATWPTACCRFATTTTTSPRPTCASARTSSTRPPCSCATASCSKRCGRRWGCPVKECMEIALEQRGPATVPPAAVLQDRAGGEAHRVALEAPARAFRRARDPRVRETGRIRSRRCSKPRLRPRPRPRRRPSWPRSSCNDPLVGAYPGAARLRSAVCSARHAL